MGQATPFLKSAATDLVYEYCDGYTYDLLTSDHSYVTNFKAIKPLFLSQSSLSLYAKASSTLGSDTSSYMYAIFQCRGDASLSQCASCVSRALSVSSVCDRWRIQLAACFVRYDYVPFYSDSEDSTYISSQWNVTCSSATDTTAAYESNLASALSTVVAAAPEHDLFGFHVAHAGTTGTASSAYVLGQCVGFLTARYCGLCLGEAHEEYVKNCGQSEGGDMYVGLCYLIVSKSSDFLFDPSIAISAPSLSSTPPPPETSETPSPPTPPGVAETTSSPPPPLPKETRQPPPPPPAGNGSDRTKDVSETDKFTEDVDGGEERRKKKKKKLVNIVLPSVILPSAVASFVGYDCFRVKRQHKREIVVSIAAAVCLINVHFCSKFANEGQIKSNRPTV
ncbi:hypothetical protein L7F22_038258 [Adiantum nelumboides]|nr:hypothetical protein [Adiantum nelumboides]